MKKKTKLLILMSMITLVMQAQEEVFTSNIQTSDAQTISMGLNTGESSIEKIEEPAALPITDHTNTDFEMAATDIEIITLQEKKDLSFSLTTSATSEDESVILSIDEFDGLNYTLTDLDGRILEANSIVSVETPMEFTFLIPSDYFIEVSSNEEILMKFKVVKK